MTARETWAVWRIYYMTYAEIAVHGDKKKELVERGLSLKAAQEKAASLGFGYYIQQEQEKS